MTRRRDGRASAGFIHLRLAFAMAIAVTMLLAAASVHAGVPQKLSYQGMLTNASSQPVNGSHTIVFRLYDAVTAGTLLYSETQTVTVTNGVFSVQIGSLTPFPTTLAFDVPYFLELVVDTETLAPRQPLASAAYALKTGCNPGDKVFCYTLAGTPGVGPCQNGLRVCNAQGTGYGPCVGQVGPNCGSVCANLATDPTNCGACSNVCPTPANATASCTAGVCTSTCNVGTIACGPGNCVDTNTSTTNCGACGNACGAGAACISGACVCPAGTVACAGGICANLASDRAHCGSCATACVSGQICSSGVCTACAVGQIVCGNTCTSTASDNNNCGMCGNVCAVGKTCTAGVCI